VSLTAAGRLFHARDAATGNERSPIDYEDYYIVLHVVELLLSGDYKVRDGGLVDEFKAVRLEFHWANTNKRGSEHYVNDTAFPLEVTVVLNFLLLDT